MRWHNSFLQLPRPTAEHVQPGDGVVVSEQLDGRLRIFVGEQELASSAVRDPSPPTPPGVPSTPRGPTGSSQGQKPRAKHPWRGRGVRAVTPPPHP